MFNIYQNHGVAEVRKVIASSWKPKPSGFQAKSGGMSLGNRTFVKANSEMIEL